MLDKTLTFKQIIIGGLFVLTGFVFALGIQATAWVNPTVPPPGGNVAAPLNTSATTQTKSGSLNIGGKVTSASTLTSDDHNTLVTKDYVDAAAGGHVRGASYGYCGVQLAADISTVVYASVAEWPMLTCGAAPTCEAGFKPIQSSPYVQLNGASSGAIPSDNNINTMISKFNHFLDTESYIVTWGCIKL